jgi:hypothetical protein
MEGNKMYQVVFSKRFTEMHRRQDGQDPNEVYDNEFGDGIIYDGTQPLPTDIERLVSTAMVAFERAGSEDVYATRNRANWLIAGARQAQKILHEGKCITSQFPGEDVVGRKFSAGATIYWLRNHGAVLAE